MSADIADAMVNQQRELARMEFEIAALKQQLAEAEAERDEAREDSIRRRAVFAKNIRLMGKRAEAANKRLRAETIEECAKAISELREQYLPGGYSDAKTILRRTEASIRALASETAGGQA